jgi:hypothetical protein
MIIVYCFIGNLPEYAVHTVYQMRLFYKGPIYFIISDIDSSYVTTLKSLDVTIINYIDVIDNSFVTFVNDNSRRFTIVHGLSGREKLFIYSFERFFVLYQLMKKYELSDILFLELDNLLYDDPLKWESNFKLYDMSYMYDNNNRCSSGICFIKNTDILLECTLHFMQYIKTTSGFVNEMTALYEFWGLHRSRIQLLPIHWMTDMIPQETCIHYDRYKSIFDAAAMGIYLCGADPYHTGGQIKKGEQWKLSCIDYTHYTYEWKRDELDRNIPYVNYNDQWIRINNLHIHSKDLVSNVSISYK